MPSADTTGVWALPFDRCPRARWHSSSACIVYWDTTQAAGAEHRCLGRVRHETARRAATGITSRAHGARAHPRQENVRS
jgi:hypothetical protein